MAVQISDTLPKGEEKRAEIAIQMAFLRALGKTWKETGEILDSHQNHLQLVSRNTGPFFDQWHEFFFKYAVGWKQDAMSVANQKMAAELERRNGKALQNVDVLLEHDDPYVKTQNTWKVINQNIGHPKVTTKLEGEITKRVIYEVPAALVNQVHARRGLPLLPAPTDYVQEEESA